MPLKKYNIYYLALKSEIGRSFYFFTIIVTNTHKTTIATQTQPCAVTAANIWIPGARFMLSLVV